MFASIFVIDLRVKLDDQFSLRREKVIYQHFELCFYVNVCSFTLKLVIMQLMFLIILLSYIGVYLWRLVLCWPRCYILFFGWYSEGFGVYWFLLCCLWLDFGVSRLILGIVVKDQ